MLGTFKFRNEDFTVHFNVILSILLLFFVVEKPQIIWFKPFLEVLSSITENHTPNLVNSKLF